MHPGGTGRICLRRPALDRAAGDFQPEGCGFGQALLQDLDPKSGKGFSLPVAGPAPVDQFGKGSTGAESGAYGHFVVVGWAGHADGRQGGQFGTDTISPSSTVQEAGKEFLFHRNN